MDQVSERHSPYAHQTDTETIRAALQQIVGARHVTCDADVLSQWLVDWRGRYSGKTFAMVAPGDTRECAEVVAFCARQGVAIVTQGGNSGMVGGATPDASGTQLLLSTRRLTALRIDPDAGTAECGAGIVLQHLHAEAEKQGWRFPLSLGGKGSATVGGLVSTNAGGTQVLRHGTMRALVLGLEVVLPDGQILNSINGLRKDNRGFDLKQLFIGSEGTLGIVTKAALKLVPAIRQRRTVWAGVESLHAARRLLLLCEKKLGPALEGFEVLPQACLDHVLEYLPGARPPLAGRHAWHALIECADSGGSHDSGPHDPIHDCLAEASERGMIEDAALAGNESQAEAFWTLRETIAPAEKMRGPAVQHDIAVAPEAMPDMVDRLSKSVVQHFPGHSVSAFGHLGDGNIHFHVIAPPLAPDDWSRTVALEISALVYDTISEHGGSISAEHGIGQDKLATLARTMDPAALALMRAVKTAVDPGGLLNPGKLVPLAPDGANP